MSTMGPHGPGAEMQPVAAVVGSSDQTSSTHEKLLAVFEAILLSVVTVIVAWSGYAAATWGSHSSLQIAHAEESDTAASLAELEARDRALTDLIVFESWFQARAAGEDNAAKQIRARFGPDLERAFRTWRTLSEEGRAGIAPTRLAQYQVSESVRADRLREQTREATEAAREAGRTSDGYVRTTVFLASVLFLVGISGHFQRAIRTAMLSLGVVLLVLALYQILQLPGLPD
jgi:hypothetical protein